MPFFSPSAGRCLLLVAAAMGTPAPPPVLWAEPATPELRPATVQAFDQYVRLTEARNDAELKRGTALLWVDGLPEHERAQAYEELQRGEVKMRRLATLDNGAAIHCPDGMIHHWVGLAFIPEAKLEDVLGVLEDYTQHAVWYAPDVERSRIESRDGDHFRVFLRFRRHKVVAVVLDTEHDVQYFHDAQTRAHSRSSAVRIAQGETTRKRDESTVAP